MLFKELKSGELNLLALGVLLAVMCLSSVAILIQGVERGLNNAMGTLLGGDRALISPVPIDQEIMEKVNALGSLGLKNAQIVTFYSMLSHEDDLTLAEVKAVSNTYPLKGEVRVSDNLFTQDYAVDFPQKGKVWLEATLFSLLDTKIGDTIQIGEANFTVEKVLTFEPDRTGEGINFAPHALINLEDLEKTAVIQPGSRQNYYLLLTGNPSVLKQFDDWINPRLSQHKGTERYLSAVDSRPTFKTIFDQTTQYLYLVVAINVILASLALREASRRFCVRQRRSVALLRCFGSQFNSLLRRYAIEISLVGFVAGFIGFILGLAAVLLFRGKFETIFLQKIEIVWLFPAILALLLVVILLLLFVVLPLNDLRHVTPMMMLREGNVSNLNNQHNLLNPPPLSTAAKFKQSSAKLKPSVSDRIRKFLINIVGQWRVEFRYGISNLIHNLRMNILQLFAFAIVMLCGWLIFLIRTDLIDIWHQRIPNEAPNYFAINIAPDEVKPFKQSLEEAHIPAQRLYPLVRGRLLAINSEPVDDSNTANNQKPQSTSIRRLLNLSYDNQLPKENSIIAGRWFNNTDEGKLLVSVEKGFAERMKIALGDSLTFQIEQKTLTLEVLSIRSVNWDTFYPNFFVLFPPKTLDSFSQSYMTSFYVSPQNQNALKTLSRKFRAMSLIDVNVILKQVMQAIQTISIAIEYLWIFTGLMTIVLLWCAIAANMDERQENALLLRVLGTNNRRLHTILLTEFLLLGLFSGIIAIIGAEVLYAWIIRKIFDLNYHFDSKTGLFLLLGPLFGAILIGVAGWFGIRKILQKTPVQLLSSQKRY